MPHLLETPRLLLRPFTLADVNEAYEVFEGHPDVYQFDPGFRRTREQRRALIERYANTNADEDVGTLAVTLRAGGALIGYAGLQLYVLPSEPLASPEVELYYKFGRTWWGQGYAFEACQVLLRFAFEEMRLARIVTITQPNNEHSLHLLRRLGFRIEPGPAQWTNTVAATLEHPRLSSFNPPVLP